MFSFPVFVQTHAAQEAWGVIYFAVHMYNEDFSPCHWLAAAASSHLHHGNSVWIVSLEASSIIGSGVSVLSLSLSLSRKVLISSGTSSSFGEYMMGLLCIEHPSAH